ncbi:MAG: FtsQ-type POTRA domain-containing protein [Clostridia bacterium]|jgi:cell division septal protein FtsQ|nr:FtsQ-type POTRA domain-containing protein [Clostridia bacterium]MCI2001037.1 FtsQ-type POTRA domain-containing protein [Clostridia bacterium]MCI2015636.1 FtsQ-type POTRA domain-containing protein [Clostridia bacterium]
MSEKQNRIERNKKQKKIHVILIVLAATVVFLLSPVFNIKKMNITEMQKYSYDEICEMTGLSNGKNIFLINRFKVLNTLKNDPYVEKAKLTYKLPDTVNLTITERKVRGYVPYMGSYLYIDENGRVLEVNSKKNNKLPVVDGLKFKGFVLGEKIDADNKDAFDIMVTIAQLITKYNLLDMTVDIDVSDTANIKAQVKNVEVNLGDFTNIDQKIRVMAQVIGKLKDNDRGTLDLSDLSKPIIFRYLT